MLHAHRLEHADRLAVLAAAAQRLAERVAQIGIVGVMLDRRGEHLVRRGVLAGVHVRRRQRQRRGAVAGLPLPGLLQQRAAAVDLAVPGELLAGAVPFAGLRRQAGGAPRAPVRQRGARDCASEPPKQRDGRAGAEGER